MAHEANSGQRPTVRPRTPIWLINRFQDQDPSDPEDDEEEIEDMATSNPAPRSYFGRLTTVTLPYLTLPFRHFLNNFR